MSQLGQKDWPVEVKVWPIVIWVNINPMTSIFCWYKIDGKNKGCLKVEECNTVPQNVSFNDEPNSMRINMSINSLLCIWILTL